MVVNCDVWNAEQSEFDDFLIRAIKKFCEISERLYFDHVINNLRMIRHCEHDKKLVCALEDKFALFHHQVDSLVKSAIIADGWN